MDRNSLMMDRDALIEQINEWNANRLDLFALTLPDERLEFHGVMRFFYQDPGAKVATKCVRVSSLASTQEVVDTLIEKFRPDMRMLTMDKYCLYEVHSNREERKLEDHERPLLEQLNWGKDDREGRFLLKREADVTAHMEGFHERPVDVSPLTKGEKKRLSKREKKDLKKKEKQAKLNKGKENETPGEQLYKELPETSFTRTISNPDAVMRRRRQQKLERKMQEFRAKDGGPDGGGTLKVFGHTLNADVPYKTLLLSTEDPADFVVKETLEKYQMDKADPNDYCLFMLHLVPAEDGRDGNVVKQEEILNDEECPLAIQLHHHPARGSLLFEIRKTPPNAQRRPRSQNYGDVGYPGYNHKNLPPNKLPYLVELLPDGTEPYNPVRHRLQADVLEIGKERSMQSEAQHLRLMGSHVLPHHAVMSHSEGVVTLTPLSHEAETYINHQRVSDTAVLQDGMTVRIGKSHLFRFVDPLHEEKMVRRQVGSDSSVQYEGRYDDNSFDQDVHGDPGLPPGGRLNRPEEKRSPDGGPGLGPRQMEDDLLPAGLQFMEDAEDHLLSGIILNTTLVNSIHFKLAPTYTLYMAVRYRLSKHYKPEMSHQERISRLVEFVDKIARMMEDVVKDNPEDANVLAFWMANSSELLHFLKKDDNVSPYTADSLDLLAGVVQLAFRSLVNVLQTDLGQSMTAFLDEANPDDEIDEDVDENRLNDQYRNRPVMSDVIMTLSAAMGLMRRCRVNAALTIQLFSLLFHYINLWLFNRIVLEPRLQLCSHYWGVLLKRRLSRIELWAEKQGLELAADCHLCRIVQTAYLLQCQKYSVDEAASISSFCFKLNSLQIRVLLESYIPERDEPYIPKELINRLVRMAENTADEMIRSEGRNVHLEEDPDLFLPFLLPEDGYSCEIMNDVPSGLPEFIEPFRTSGLCMLIPHQNVSGSWTVYMDAGAQYTPNLSPPLQSSPPHSLEAELSARNLPPEPDVALVQFDKVRGSLGLSIVAAQGENQKERGVYVKAVVPGGAADLDGRINAGDQLLAVDGRSLIGLSQEEAAKLMTQTGNRVTLKIAVQGAVYHGLETMLSKPSPPMTRAADSRPMLPPGDDPRNKPPQFGSRENMAPGYHGNQGAPPPLHGNQQQPLPGYGGGNQPGYPGNQPGYPGNQRGLSSQQMAQSRSTPALNDSLTEPYRDDYPPVQPGPGKDRSRSVSNLIRNEPPMDEDRRRLQSTGSAFPRDPRDIRMNHTSSQPALNTSQDDERYANFQPRALPGLAGDRPPPGPPPGHEHPGVQMRHHSERTDRPKSALIPNNREENFRVRPKSEDIDAEDWRNHDRPQMSPLKVNLSHAGNPARRESPNDPRIGGPPSPAGRYDPRDPRFDPRTDPRNEPRMNNVDSRMNNADPRMMNQEPGMDPRMQKQDVRMQNAIPRNVNGDHRMHNTDPRMSNSDLRMDPRLSSSDPRMDPRLPNADPRMEPRLSSSDPRSDPRMSNSDLRIDPRMSNSDLRSDPRMQNAIPRNQNADPRMQNPRTDPRMQNADPRMESRMQNVESRMPNADPRMQNIDPRMQNADPRMQNADPRMQNIDPRMQNIDPRMQNADPRMSNSDPRMHLPDPRMSNSDLRLQVDPRDPRSQEMKDSKTDFRDLMQDPRMDPRNTDPGRERDPRFQDPRMDMKNQDPRSSDPRIEESRAIKSDPRKDLRSDDEPQFRDARVDWKPGPRYEPPKDIKIDPNRPRLSVHAKIDPAQLSPSAAPHSPQREDRRRSASPEFPPPPELPSGPHPDEEELPPPPPHPQNYQPNRYSGSYAQLNQPAPFGSSSNQITSIRFQPKPAVQPKPDRNSLTDRNSVSDRSSLSRPENGRLSSSEMPNRPAERIPSSSSLQSTSRTNLLSVSSTLERSASPWDRDKREEELKRQEEELARMRDEEVAILESKGHLTPEEQARLQRLRLDQEFRRRVAELPKDDEEEDENELERQERTAERERMVKMVKEDLERSHRAKAQREEAEREEQLRREQELNQKKEHRLSLFEKEQEEMRMRQKRKQEQQEREQEKLLRKQRELHEKARQEQEENRRFIQEEEKRIEAKRLEEVRRKKEQERQQLKEMEAAREAEEEEKRQREKIALIRQESREEFHKPNYMINYPAQTSPQPQSVPQPPARGSSYGMLNRRAPEKDPNLESDLYMRGFQQARTDSLPNKKSVSFDSRLATEITEREAQQRFPPPTVNRYEPDRYEADYPPQSPGRNAYQQANQQAFGQYATKGAATPPKYGRDEGNYVVKTTPGVVGAQEVYRDPRDRALAAKRQSQDESGRPGEQLSFKDKMKMFAETAGENTPKDRAKSSRSQRVLEMNLAM